MLLQRFHYFPFAVVTLQLHGSTITTISDNTLTCYAWEEYVPN